MPHRRQQDEVFHIYDARSLVGSLNQSAQSTEVPPFAVRHAVICQPHKQIRCHFDFAEEFVRFLHRPFFGCLCHRQIGYVELLPHLR